MNKRILQLQWMTREWYSSESLPVFECEVDADNGTDENIKEVIFSSQEAFGDLPKRAQCL